MIDKDIFCVYCINTGKYNTFAGEVKCPNPKCRINKNININPKDKANDLYDSFKSVRCLSDEDEFIKLCLKIMLDEINSNVLVGIDIGATWGSYWKLVEREVEKL
jgi:hypothetical protein